MKKIQYIVILISFFMLPFSVSAAPTPTFHVLVDLTQMNSDEAIQAARFAADGIWAIPNQNKPKNYPQPLDWAKIFSDLHANRWTVTEQSTHGKSDNLVCPDQTNANLCSAGSFISKTLGRLANGAMFYNEDGLGTPLTDNEIAWYSRYVFPDLPSLGPLGNRIIVHTRSYFSPRKEQMNHALQNSSVSGGTFEFTPNNASTNNFADGCKYIVSLGKKCYLLMPPRTTSTDYLKDIQDATNYFSSTGLLTGSTGNNVYFVIAVYVREQTSVHYLSTGPNDHNSIEAVVKWLNTYRNISNPTPTPAPIPGDLTSQGDTTNNHVNIYDYNILIGNFGKTGSNIVGDIDHNNKVDIFDYNILVGNFGK